MAERPNDAATHADDAAAHADDAATHTSQPMRGRFAPSPTGPLHFGSLVAALASYLDARSRGGEWLVRIEDLDPPREVAGAAESILQTLHAFGLHWDSTVRYQSRKSTLYSAALGRLVERDLAYPCACTRREIAAVARMGIDGPVYPGRCRNGLPARRSPRAWRVRAPHATVQFHDECFGSLPQDVAQAVGDFVLRRADGLFAYQFAVVVDDADQGVTRIVRGADLLDSSQRQIALQRLLGLPTPAYRHVPIAIDANGRKLSKQTLARALERTQAGAALVAALAFLGQSPPAELSAAQPQEILHWAQAHWCAEAIPCARAALAPEAMR